MMRRSLLLLLPLLCAFALARSASVHSHAYLQATIPADWSAAYCDAALAGVAGTGAWSRQGRCDIGYVNSPGAWTVTIYRVVDGCIDQASARSRSVPVAPAEASEPVPTVEVEFD